MAVNCCEVPAAMLAFAGMIAIELKVALVISIEMEADFPPKEAEMLALAA
jgi:hypothetical protein